MPSSRFESGWSGAPSLPSGYLPRPRLSETLLHAECRLRLICAPVGSGKSFLLRECARQCPVDIRLHWLDLKGLPLGEGEFLQLFATTLGLERADLATLQAHLAQQHSPVWLMLDDFPRLPDERLDNCLNQLLRASSPQVCWWLASRRRPKCQLERLLLEGELFEFGGDELALTAAELGELLTRHGHGEDTALSGSLMAQTRGWVAGVRLRLHGHEPGQPLENARGDERIQSYLEREVFLELPEQWQQALCSLACLHSFSAALCEHLLGVGEGARLLRQLHDCGVLIEALDSNPGHFRVHPAVAPVLAAGVAEQSKRALYRHACQWFAGQDQVRQAIDYALLAEQPEVAASLLQRFTQDLILQGRGMAQVLQWRSALPEQLLASTPRLLLLASWTLLLSGHLDEAEQCAGQLQRFLPQPNARRQRELLAQCQALAGKIAYHRGIADLPCLVEALTHLPEIAWAQRLATQSALIELHLVEGRFEAAQELNRDAVKLARKYESQVMEGILLLQHVQLLEIRGELGRADSLLERLQRELNMAWKDEVHALRGRVLLRRAGILVRLGRYAEAAPLYQAGQQECLECGDPAAFWGYLGMAELDAAEHDLTLAFSRLTDAERLLQYRHITEPLYQSLLVLGYGKLWLQQGRIERAEEALEKCLRQFRGPQGHKPPYGSPELAHYLELLLAQAQLAAGQNVIERVESLLQDALAAGRRVLACELWFTLAEAHYAQSQQNKAQSVLLDALSLSRQLGLASVEHFFGLRNPGLLRWAREALFDAGGGAAALLLSRRELSVLELIALGLPNNQIAERLYISLHTVKSHAQRINMKLGVSSRTQALVRAKELGLVK
ncbi:HTH-type transcriptional regulator MalT [compost metagenome]